MPKLLRIAGLGGLVWGTSLVWPEINLALAPPVLTGLAAWLAMASLFYLANRPPARCPMPYRREQPSNRPSRPVPLRN